MPGREQTPALADRGTRPTWDKATDEQILEEIDAVIAAGYTHVAFGTAVRNFLVDRGLWDEVMRRVNVRPA